MKTPFFADAPQLSKPALWFGRPIAAGCVLLGLLLDSSARLDANVYATDIRLNSRAASTPLYIPCGSVEISYRLNEDASAGVTIDVLAGTNVVRSFVNGGGTAGALRGTNSLVWDGKDGFGNLVPIGDYSVRITAASEGHGEWSQISDELNPANYAWAPVGIAVNCNTSSPCYGRVFVANASEGPNPGFNSGDRVGILVLNADGSRVGRAGFSSGDWAWTGDGFSPWKIEVSADDHVYVNDWGSNGVVLRFDQAISPESRRLVVRPDNYPSSGADLGGLFVTGSGTNTEVWMTDVTTNASAGVRRWSVGAAGAAGANDLGVTVVQAGEGSDLNVAPYDLAVDRSNRICTVQYCTAVGDPAPRVLCFTNHNPATLPLTNAAWKVGGGDNFKRGASGVAVDPSGTYVAVAFRGALVSGSMAGGRTTIFELASGNVVTNIVTDEPYSPSHEHTDVAWDNVGNLYDLDYTKNIWRVYSPPGSNVATTVAPHTVRVAELPLVPVLEAVSYANGQFQLTLTGRTNTTYVIEASTDFQGWAPVATNRGDCARLITVKAAGPRNFYRATVLASAGPVLPVLHAVAWTNSQFAFTLAGEANASYVVLAAANLSTNAVDWVRVLTNTSPNAVRALTLPAPEGRSFYRAVLGM